MAEKSFDEGLDELAALVGEGLLVGQVEVDQVYAQFQHEGLDLHHPRGGKARYLADPLNERYRRYLQHIADKLLETGPIEPMIDSMEDLSDQVEEHAPLLFGNLRESGHPSVSQGGELVYDRPPIQHRLTEKELEEQRRTGIRHRHLHPEQYGEGAAA